MTRGTAKFDIIDENFTQMAKSSPRVFLKKAKFDDRVCIYIITIQEFGTNRTKPEK
eukprot:Awhi_evm1s4069